MTNQSDLTNSPEKQSDGQRPRLWITLADHRESLLRIREKANAWAEEGVRNARQAEIEVKNMGMYDVASNYKERRSYIEIACHVFQKIVDEELGRIVEGK
jgi:hypothetical protein